VLGDAIAKPVVTKISGSNSASNASTASNSTSQTSGKTETDVEGVSKRIVKAYEDSITKECIKWHLDVPDFQALWSNFKKITKPSDLKNFNMDGLPPRVISKHESEVFSESVNTIANPETNKHLRNFYELSDSHIPQGDVGKPLWDYLAAVGEDGNDYWKNLAEADKAWFKKPMSRKRLLSMCSSEKKFPTRICFLGVLAFMVHRIDHVKAAWALIESIEPVLNKIRTTPDMSRQKAYDNLWRLRAVDGLPGLRPATYCSLIYFLRPKQDGYMLSSHTAKSVNLLASQEVILLNKSGYPTDDNSSIRYEAYCQLIDAIGRSYPGGQMTGGDIEERLQSEDEPLGEWREYLQNHEVR